MSSDYESIRFETESYRNRKVYNFKSVGELSSTVHAMSELSKPDPLPIGIKTPMEFGRNSIFSMHTDIGSQVADNLRNLIQTNHGERLGLYDFGANLQELVFEFGSEEFEIEAVGRIKRATNKYMPFVNMQTFQSFIDHNDNKEVAKAGLRITYIIPKIDKRTRSLEVLLYVGG